MEKWKVGVNTFQKENGNTQEKRSRGVWVKEKETQNRGAKCRKTVVPRQSHLARDQRRQQDRRYGGLS